MKRAVTLAGLALAVGLGACENSPQPTGPQPASPRLSASQAPSGVNVVLKQPATAAILSDLRRFGSVLDQIVELDAVRLRSDAANLDAIRALPYVADASLDAERHAAPIDPLTATNFASGRSTWSLDAVNVTSGPGTGTRAIPFDGTGVYVGVLDTGLLDTWRQYFPDERIAEEYGASFSGGGAYSIGQSAFQPNKWEHDGDSHGTHVTSVILGYNFLGTPVSGVAPNVTVIPIKVLNQNGSGWSAPISRGLVYLANLKAGPLAGHPVVANMSLGGSALDAIEKAAIDYAIARGVIVVASAGNNGDEAVASRQGMGYPGAYAPVISVAAAGWTREWLAGDDASTGNWWWRDDVAEPTSASDFYIADFSSRAFPGQDLDVAAPGSWIVGPYQYTSAKLDYYFVGGTSQASPHVAGIVALMAQQNPALTAAQAESRLEATAIPLGAGCRTVVPQPGLAPAPVCWGADKSGAGLATADRALGLGGGKRR